jgi:hypothetical protein
LQTLAVIMTCPMVCDRFGTICSDPSHGGGQTVRFLNASLFHMLLAETDWKIDYDACDHEQGCMMCGKHFVEACKIAIGKRVPTSRASIAFISHRLLQYFVDRVTNASTPGLSNWIAVTENTVSTYDNARRAIKTADPLRQISTAYTNKAIMHILGPSVPLH